MPYAWSDVQNTWLVMGTWINAIRVEVGEIICQILNK